MSNKPIDPIKTCPNGCIYLGVIQANKARYCRYILDTGKPRGCACGPDCDKVCFDKKERRSAHNDFLFGGGD